MKVLSVSYNHCGAPLEVPAKTRYLTCSYCGSRLEVHREGSAVYTEVLEAIDRRTQKIADDVAFLKRQSELEQLDRDWMDRRRQFTVRNKQGHESVPTTGGSVAGAAIMGGFGVLWTIVALAITSGSPFPVVGFVFPLFGVLFVVGAIAMGVSTCCKAEAYQREKREYAAQRHKLLRSLSEMEREEQQP